MLEKLKVFWARVKFIWSNLKVWQRVTIISVGILIMLSLLFVVIWASRPDYVPLFTNLTVEDQAAIVEKLKEFNVPYKIDPEYNAILVPASTVYETRLKLVAEGLPKGKNIGFELFDKTKFGMTDFQEQVAYLRALEGELARTIEGMEIVESAKVNIVIPSEKLFLEEQQPATASVLVKLTPGAKITPDQVKAIINLVSKSVEGLQPENVVVVDTLGTVLSDMVMDDFFIKGPNNQITTVQKELERKQELELEKKLKVMLDRIYGPGKSIVRVKVELDFDKMKLKREEYIPGPKGKGIPRSQQTIEETYKGKGAPPGGAPGTETNIPGYNLVTEGETQIDYARTEEITNYEISKEEKEIVATPGDIKRLSVSVIIDGVLSQDVLENLRQVVAAAVGYNPKRGDQIVVQAIKFSTEWADKLREELEAERRRKLIAIIASIIAFIIFLLSYLLYRWYKSRKAKEEEEIIPEVPTLEELLSRPELLAEKGELSLLEEQLRVYASKNPEEIAKLVRNWLTEE